MTASFWRPAWSEISELVHGFASHCTPDAGIGEKAATEAVERASILFPVALD